MAAGTSSREPNEEPSGGLSFGPAQSRRSGELIEGRDLKAGDLVFVGKHGGAWRSRDHIAKEFAEIKKAADVDFPEGSGFQWLRHTFSTIAEQETGDLLAVQCSLGHSAKSITQNYLHGTYDSRLKTISRTVEKWLIGPTKKKK